MQLVYSFDNKRLPDVTEVGGKALELIRMKQHGFPVPGGLVLTTAFFDPWFAALGPGADKSACTGLRFSDAQLEALGAGLKVLARADGASPLFAVRSSSPEEDLAEASFAGGYETILGVGEEGLEAAVVRCFASCFDERVHVYKRKQGIAPGSRRHAVIVQVQINPETAGVAFSINPVNNCYDEAVINANYGLGESVVSGHAEPDHFVVDKVNARVLETRIGSKAVAVSLGAEGGTVVQERSGSHATCISSEQALRISGLLQRVENQYGYPVDIEWAIAGDDLYLLQVRPITTHFQLPAEMVTAPGERKNLYANSTLIEQGLQEPLSVLGAEFVQFVLRSMGRAMGGDMVGPDGTTFTAGGRYYMNMSYGIKLSGKKMAFAPGSMDDDTLKEMLDQINLAEYLPTELPARLKRLRWRALLSIATLALPILRAYLWPQAFVRRFQAALPAHVRKFDLPRDDGRDLSQQAEYLTGLLDFFNIEYGIPLVLAAQLAQLRIKRLFANGGREIRDALANLGAALPGNKTAEMGALMHRLAAAPEIQTTATADRFFRNLESQAFSEPFVR
ncbi:MAG TPA: PEP/pyruvate-binding domain-containing protein, partial [Symbiobacteriaceae bacterium]|nr:PEP/pyruvate-binding domain-containing protein [Symbiobacteriaceae bacterium]